MGDAQKGTGEAAEAFREAGITSNDLDTALKQAAAHISQMEDGTEKAGLTMKLFGTRSGLTMVELMDLGEKGINTVVNRMKELGHELDIDKVNKLASYKQTIEELSVTFKLFAVDSLPLVISGFDVLSKVVQNAGLWMKEFQSTEENLEVKNLKKLKEELISIEAELEKGPPPQYSLRALGNVFEFNTRKAEVLKKQIKDIQDLWKSPAATLAPEKKVGGGEYVTPPEPDWIKKWVAGFEGFEYAFKQLGIISTATTQSMVKDAMRYTRYLEDMVGKGMAAPEDLINAYNKTIELMKKLPLTREMVAKKETEIEANKYDALEKLEEEYEANVKALADDPEKSRKVQKLIDDLMKVRKTIMDTAEKSKLELKATVDVSEARKNLDNLISEYNNKTINLNVQTAEDMIATGGGGTSWTDYVSGNVPFFKGGGMEDAEKSWNNFKDNLEKGADGFIRFYGEGSSRKPLSDKIQEFISQMGGLEKASSSIQANIEFIGASAEYTKLATKLKGIEAAFPGYSDLVQLTKSGWEIQQGLPYYMEQQAMIILDIKSMMEQMRLRMLGSQLEMGSYQTGTDYVPQTGLYKLHKGESVNPPGVLVGDVIITVGGGSGADATVDAIVKALKYKLSGKLSDALRKN
jgi:hypothetical protein